MMFNTYVLKQHMTRAWRRHWPLQVASVTVMSLVLLIVNFMFLGFSAFHHTLSQWGNGMEMVVYLKEDADMGKANEWQEHLKSSGDFESVRFVSKAEATKKFLTELGSGSLALMEDPKWSSPIPASFELRIADHIALDRRLASMQAWSAQFRGVAWVEDVFYGQGWVENFARFLSSMRLVVIVFWALSLSVGLLIVSNCIRLSFMQRFEEIAILELVGATSRFIRVPFVFEGLVLGLLASFVSLGISYGVHSLMLGWLAEQWSFWSALNQVPPLQTWHIVGNVVTGVAFGVAGAWNCMRKLNNGWAAVR